jgi:hypothetical protein
MTDENFIEKEHLFDNKYTTVPKLLNDIVRAQRKTDLTFRGISRIIENKPKIQRVRIDHSTKTVDCSDNEYQMLNDFYRLGRPYFTVNYEILDYVACAQHYGVPTRLIDWTRDPFVALFFAVYNNPEPDNGEYKMYYAELSEHTVIDRIYRGTTWIDIEGGSEFILECKNFIDMICNKEKLKEELVSRNSMVEKIGITENCMYREDGLLFFNPPPSNDRLIAQQGLFSIPVSLVGDDASREVDLKTSHFTIVLDTNKRQELINYLANMNYSPTRLFPELESIGNYISRKYVNHHFH